MKQKLIDLKEQFPRLKIHIDTLKNNTSFKIGGEAIFVEPKNISQIQKVIKFCKRNNINYFILGRGTNILASNKINRLIIKLSNNFSKIKRNKNKLIAQSGASLFSLITYGIKNGLGGMEELYGIPGSVGGAVVMNAGSYGKTISDFVDYVVFFDGQKLHKWKAKKLQFSYRNSLFLNKKYIILEVGVSFKKVAKAEAIRKCRSFIEKRWASQPYCSNSAGSVFKRPEGNFAPILIEKCGLKGYVRGDAEVSTKHCGFIVNNGNAKYSDIISIIYKIRKTVFKKFDILLLLEIIILGENDETLG